MLPGALEGDLRRQLQYTKTLWTSDQVAGRPGGAATPSSEQVSARGRKLGLVLGVPLGSLIDRSALCDAPPPPPVRGHPRRCNQARCPASANCQTG